MEAAEAESEGDAMSEVSKVEEECDPLHFQPPNTEGRPLYNRPLKLIRPVATRWTSHCNAVERALLLQTEIEEHLASYVPPNKGEASLIVVPAVQPHHGPSDIRLVL